MLKVTGLGLAGASSSRVHPTSIHFSTTTEQPPQYPNLFARVEKRNQTHEQALCPMQKTLEELRALGLLQNYARQPSTPH